MDPQLLPAEVIRRKRDGGRLSAAQIHGFAQGLADGGWADAQAAALAMAIVWRGMDDAECVTLTQAMTDSGVRLRWDALRGRGPVLDKHSTGGVGDKVSLVLAPIVAACGGLVPMVSGRGLGHTGGTLDKLEALPGYNAQPAPGQLLDTLRSAGCAIVGAGPRLAPADRRLYAIRDVTATVESVPLITASILSKKLAAGLDALVLDVKHGNGAFMPGLDAARALALNLVRVARGAGLAADAVLSDMNQVLGHSAGNALEVTEAQDLLLGRPGADARLRALSLRLSAGLLVQGGLAPDLAAAERQAETALGSGRAAEAWARMVAALGGPADVLANARLPAAPVQRSVPAPRAGLLAALDTRAVGLAVVTLGGGRRRPGDAVDPRVGFSHLRSLGSWLQAGEPLATVHAADTAAAEAAAATLQAAITWADAPDTAPAPLWQSP